MAAESSCKKAKVLAFESERLPRQRFLRPALLLMVPSEHHLRLAAQIGVTDIVCAYPGSSFEQVSALKAKVEAFGLNMSVIERLVPHDQIVHNKPGREAQLENFKTLIRSMGKAGVKTLCYNWMPADDWSRCSVTEPERGGALVTNWIEGQASALADEAGRAAEDGAVTPAEELWANLEYFLRAVVPVAEECGVELALHPDDPPVPLLRGKPQIMYNVAAMERAAKLVPSPANGLCFCQGTFASGGENVLAGIAKVAPYIKYVHFRDVVGTVPHFQECFQDNGKTDMAACMRAYADAGVRDVAIRPDHVPTLDGEQNAHPGYEMLGRLWAVGYINGMMDTIEHDAKKAAAAAAAAASAGEL